MGIKDDLPEGLYVIRNCASTNYVLDVYEKGMANGSNIIVCTANYQTNQTWRLKWNSDGTCYLICVCNGKCADVEYDKIVSGQNVSCFDYRAQRNQKWVPKVGTKKVTVGDKTLQSYFLHIGNASKIMETAGSPSEIHDGSNVVISEKEPNDDQEWLFDPLETIHDGGVYEIRPLANVNNCLDSANSGTTNGTKIYSWARNNGNNQKWVLIKDNDYWKIRVGYSTMCLDVGTGTPTSGQDVQAWSDNSSRNQRWTIETISTYVLNGDNLPVVKIHPKANTSLDLDNRYNSSSSGNSVGVHTDHDEDNSLRWILVPTTLVDPTMPVPNIQGMVVGSVDATATSRWRNHDNGDLFLKGTCPQSWTTKNGNSFRIRWRTRTFSIDGKWSAWSSYNAWRTPLMKQSTPNWWFTQAFNESTMNPASVKQKQYQFEMQTQGVDDYKNVTSSTGTQTITISYHPTSTITGATLTPDGIRVMFSTNYPHSMTFYVSSVKCNGKQILTKTATCITDEDNNTFDIPFEYLKSIPADGSTLAFTYTFSTDVSIKFTTALTQTATMVYGQGNVSKYPLTLVEDNVAGNQQKWYFAPSNDKLSLLTSDGELYPLTKNSDGYWLIPKFMEDLTIIGLWENSDASEWCARVDTVKASDVAFHGFTWGEEDGVIVWLNKDEVLKEERNFTADAEEHTLLGRAHPYVSYTANQQNGNNFTKVSATVNGYVLPDRLEDYGTTPASVERMLEVGHCLYRSPKGRISNVAVTDASLTFERGLIQIQVSYIEEAL